MILKLLTTQNKRPMWQTFIGLSMLVILAGCTATSGNDANPILRKFQWFSYLEGGDFQKTCTPGSPERYRLIYTAIYKEQVRIYNVMASNLTLKTRVILPMDIRNFAVSSFAGLLDPWRGTEATVQLAPSDISKLTAALDHSGVFEAPNVGAELSSKGFYWTIAACHDGAYFFTGFVWPSPEWDALSFPARLFALDPTNIDINPPRPTKTGWELGRPTKTQHLKQNQFHLKVGKHGLDKLGDLF